MTRSVRTHVVGDTLSDRSLAPKHLSKQDFGRRLYKLMTERGWHQSELARRSGIERANISNYINGKSLPTVENARKLADALGCTPEELLPNVVESAIDRDSPALEIKVSPGAPGAAWLRVNRLTSMSTALKIAELLQEDDVTDRSRSSEGTTVQHGENQTAAAKR